VKDLDQNIAAATAMGWKGIEKSHIGIIGFKLNPDLPSLIPLCTTDANAALKFAEWLGKEKKFAIGFEYLEGLWWGGFLSTANSDAFEAKAPTFSAAVTEAGLRALGLWEDGK